MQETYKDLPEERSLMPKLTIFEQVRYLAALKGMSTAEVKENYHPMELQVWEIDR